MSLMFVGISGALNCIMTTFTVVDVCVQDSSLALLVRKVCFSVPFSPFLVIFHASPGCCIHQNSHVYNGKLRLPDPIPDSGLRSGFPFTMF